MTNYRPTGFLSPTGEFIECSTYYHSRVAGRICDANGWPYGYPNKCASDILADKGYLHFTITEFLSNEYFIIFDKHFSEIQKNIVKEIIEHNDENLIPIDRCSLWEVKKEIYGEDITE